MAKSNNDTLELTSVTEALSSAPPSWEEVMEEKKLKMQTEKVEKLSSTNNEKLSNLVEMEANQIDEAEGINSINVAYDDIKVLTPTERLIETLNKIICFLKAVSRWSTTISDLILWLCSLAVLWVGCWIISQHYEVTKIVYRDQFRMIGQMLVVISSLNIVVFCPFGIFGTWKNKRVLLKLHNIWMFFNVLVHLILLFVCFKYIHKGAGKQQKDFRAHFTTIYNNCDWSNSTAIEQCCCWEKRAKICWQYEPDPKYPKGNQTDIDYQFQDMQYKKLCKTENLDYFKRWMTVIEKGFFYLAWFTAVEIPALGFAVIQIQLLMPDETDAKKRKKRRKPPKGKVRKIYHKARHMVCRRFLLVLFAILFYVGFVFCKLWYKQFKIKVGLVELNLLDILWDQMKKTFSISDESNDRKPN